MVHHNYFLSIMTNPAKTVLYTGVTNNLRKRLSQHFEARGKTDTSAGKYYCFHLISWERHGNVLHAIEREKEIKGWRREKKVKLIESFNREWKFLNGEVE